jgi:hypothetical protein
MVTLGTIGADVTPATLVAERTRHSFPSVSESPLSGKHSNQRTIFKPVAGGFFGIDRQGMQLLWCQDVVMGILAQRSLRQRTQFTSYLLPKNTTHPFRTGHEIVLIARRGVF